MRKVLLFLAMSISPLSAADNGFDGRWNIHVLNEPRSRAWWLEVQGATTGTPKGRFVGAPGGDMNDVPEISVRGGELRFVFERRYRRAEPGAPPPPMQKGVYKARLAGGKLEGTFQVEGSSRPAQKWIGYRAPVITEKDDGSWREGRPVALFNGKDLSNWRPMVAGQELGWTVRDGLMANTAGANNLISEQKFWNFRLLAEFRLGPKTNGGIGLRGRYEVQILEDFGRPPDTHSNGALYSRIVPSVNASKPPGEWQTYDIRLVGRQVTVILNGKKVIDKGEIEGLTAMANDFREAEPGHITIQGDHGPVEFRKLVVIPLVK